MTYDIFISYRRSSGVNVARMLEQALKARGYTVFFDYNSLRDGEFNRNIFDAIDGARVFLMLMSHESLDRCVNADDWVGYEIKRALGSGMCIVPVIPSNQDCTIPDALSSEFDPVRAMKPLPVDMGIRFEESVDEIERRFPEELRKWHRRTGDTFSTIDPASELFVGRDAEIGHIHELLSAGRIPVITGAGGCGKSEIIRQYAKRFRMQYPGGMFQIDAESVMDWDDALSRLLARCDDKGESASDYISGGDAAVKGGARRRIEGDEVSEALGKIVVERGPVLLFADNVESVKSLLGDASRFPACFRMGMDFRVDIVVSARVSDVRFAGTDDPQEIALADLTSAEAVDLLLREHPAENQQDREDAVAIAGLLGNRALFLRRVPALIQDEECGTYRSVLDSLRRNLMYTVNSQVDGDHMPSVLWKLSCERLSKLPLGPQSIRLAQCASFFSPDGFAEHVLSRLWTTVVTKDCPNYGKRFERALNILLRHNLVRRSRLICMHRLDRAAILGTAKSASGLENDVADTLADYESFLKNDWITMAEHPVIFSRLPNGMSSDGSVWSAAVGRNPDLAERCPWPCLGGLDWGALLGRQPQFAEQCPWEKFNVVAWSVLLGKQPQFADLCPWGKFSDINWRFILRKQPQFADRCRWEDRKDISFWTGLLARQPQFGDRCPWERFKGDDWRKLLQEQPRFADRCQWEELGGSDWAELLVKQPQFADRCPWEKLGGKDWGVLLAERPQFADLCPWDELSGCDWCAILPEQPQFAVRCPWTILDGHDWCSLLARSPQYSVRCPWNVLDGAAWSGLLQVRPEFADKCQWDRLGGSDWSGLLGERPEFSDRCRWESLSGWDWVAVTQWSRDGLLWKQPQFADRCPWERLNGDEWRKLLQEQPQFADRCRWELLDGKGWSRLLWRQPQFADRCQWEKLTDADWSFLLKWQPQFGDRRRSVTNAES